MFHIKLTYLHHSRAGWTLPLTSIMALLGMAANRPTTAVKMQILLKAPIGCVGRVRGSTAKEHNLQRVSFPLLVQNWQITVGTQPGAWRRLHQSGDTSWFWMWFQQAKSFHHFTTEKCSCFYHATSFATRTLWFLRSPKQFSAWPEFPPNLHKNLHV